MSKEKIDNNLFMVIINGHKKQYYTSATRIAKYINMQPTLLMYNIGKGKQVKDANGNTYDITLIDGSDIPYRLINNKMMEE